MTAFARFVGRDDLARRVLERVGERRLATQIEPDGRQPHELARTRSLSYATMNLVGFSLLARHGETLGVDLWSWRDAAGRGIEAAARWLLPYVLGDQTWTHQQISPFVLNDHTLWAWAWIDAAYGLDASERLRAIHAGTIGPLGRLWT